MRRALVQAALTLLFAFSLSADEAQYTITPASGPSTGGTVVRITGPLGDWPYSVVFDEASATTTTRIDDHTLEAITPAHPAGISRVRLFEYDIYIDTGLTFEFIGRDQYLLPVFIEPIQGAFGSEFRTELHGFNTGQNPLDIWGLETTCRPSPPICNWLTDAMVTLLPNETDIADYFAFQTGSPGRFIEVPFEQAEDLSLSLRVYDTSRAAENFGTEIPVVHRSEFRRKPFTLLDVPTDPRFRNTLRVYAHAETAVRVQFGNETHLLTLRPGAHVFDPAYAQFTAFPTGTQPIRVTITPDPTGPAVWAFISVTNNETQHITTITP